MESVEGDRGHQLAIVKPEAMECLNPPTFVEVKFDQVQEYIK